ncbi:hypothetical protein BG011_008027 [Mortierella polycephala]|uniref:Calcineurin-like phosphoesterase domain-containing protein n=1 Tax=Mortierella polycephala TaxID=41804 RepID=A0A9P6PRB5_9FUNG|nr:hypothetical protein BG011_008027 [Mortierella polycephala]
MVPLLLNNLPLTSPRALLQDTDDAALRERYRIAVIADPQLTDWLSYHQSGILLTLVETYTDIFMKRSFHRLHASLRPDAVIFVGDLNDGGRLSQGEVFEKNKHRFMDRVFESKSSAWNQRPVVMDAVDAQQSPSEPRVSKRQNNDPPLGEEHINITGRYQQMVDIPQSARERAAMRNAGKSVRLFVAGNHDVGFGDTLIRSSMNRYKQVWGSVNYEVQVGNHSLIVLDTLALSSGTQSIREESQLFLTKLTQENQTYPRILFTHVPLFRPDTTFCGDKREHKNGIVDGRGRQYQNMVSTQLSDEILRGIRPDMIFSGDDHDWCEIAHPLDGSATPEVSVPTFSFAQGTHQPAFMMLSLYNPDHKTKNVYPMVSASSGLPVSTEDSVSSMMRPSGDATFAYEECMLPDQLAIYLCYGALFAMTLNWIMIARYRWMTRTRRMLSQRSILVQWNEASHGSTTATAPLLQSLAQQQQQQQRNGEYTGETTYPLSNAESPQESLAIEEASLKAKRILWPLRMEKGYESLLAATLNATQSADVLEELSESQAYVIERKKFTRKNSNLRRQDYNHRPEGNRGVLK